MTIVFIIRYPTYCPNKDVLLRLDSAGCQLIHTSKPIEVSLETKIPQAASQQVPLTPSVLSNRGLAHQTQMHLPQNCATTASSPASPAPLRCSSHCHHSPLDLQVPKRSCRWPHFAAQFCRHGCILYICWQLKKEGPLTFFPINWGWIIG